MDDIAGYLEQIAEPTVEDFEKHPGSIRHAFLACAAVFHAIDRMRSLGESGNLRRTWRDQSMDFTIVDIVAHHFKHVRSNDEKISAILTPLDHMPLPAVVFTRQGMETRNLFFVVRDAVKFIRQQAGLIASGNEA